MAPVSLTVYAPKTKEGAEVLARQVSAIHAATVIHRLKTLNCPSQQKLALLDSIINTAKNHSREQGS